MNPKKVWISILGGGGLGAALAGFMIWSAYGTIAAAREQVDGLKLTIDASRKLLTQTGELERDVIVLRETEQAIKEILPDEQDLNNLVRDLHRFEEESGVHITGLKKKTEPVRGKNQKDTSFDKVTYSLTTEADAFQWLAFLDRIESHMRFMSVPSFKLGAASRQDIEDTGAPLHKITMDVETYVYKPQGELTSVKIDGYQRKRELLLGEIARHRGALAIPTYQYRGPRGRRDPWVDPRVPVPTEDDGGLPLEAQMLKVDELVKRTDDAFKVWESVPKAENIVEAMNLKHELEQKLALLEEDVRRLEDEGAIRFPLAKSKFDHQVIDRVVKLRGTMNAERTGAGPSLDQLTALLETMQRHMVLGEYDHALSAFNAVEPSLPNSDKDADLKPVIGDLRALAKTARIAADFQERKLEIGGTVIVEGREPVVLINGRSWSEGDMLDSELVIQSIRKGEIEFLFKGVILLRRL